MSRTSPLTSGPTIVHLTYEATTAPIRQLTEGPAPKAMAFRRCSRLAQVDGRGRSYRYVGPVGLKTALQPGSGGDPIGSAAGFDSWIAGRSVAELAEPFTSVVDTDGVLRLAPGEASTWRVPGEGMILSAGEIALVREADWWAAGEVSNQPTVYCPDVISWSAVARALDRARIGRPSGFTHEVVFRRCPDCQEHNVPRENDFVCVFYGSDLPETWNVDPIA